MNAIDRMNAENPWEITVISIRNKKKFHILGIAKILNTIVRNLKKT